MNNKNILKWALIIGIIIVLNLFFHFSTKLLYKPVKFEDFCQTKQVNIQPSTKESCLKKGGAWNEGPEGKPVPANIDTEGRVTPANINAYCDTNFTCQKEFEIANNFYRRNIFIILIILGLISLGIGFALSTNEVISISLSYGGILSFIVASMEYWSAMDDYLRVIILGFALIILIYLGYKKFKTQIG